MCSCQSRPAPGGAVGAEIVRSWHEAESRKVLKPAVAALQQAGLEPAWFYRVGHPGTVISEWAAEHGTDLIVMGSHGRTAMKNLLFGSVTQSVLASSTVPVLVLRTAHAPKAESLRVGVALDGSAYGRAAADYVLAHRALFGLHPEFTLLHVIESAGDEVLLGQDNQFALPAGAKRLSAEAEACERVLAPVARKFSEFGTDVEQQCIIGRPGEEIARFAMTAPLDILVMGSHGHGALTSALVGSVAWRVAAACNTPLLLIRRVH